MDPDLQVIINAWHDIPKAVKAGIVVMAWGQKTETAPKLFDIRVLIAL